MVPEFCELILHLPMYARSTNTIKKRVKELFLEKQNGKDITKPLLQLSAIYKNPLDRDIIRGEFLRHHMKIPDFLGGSKLAGLYEELNDRNQ